MSIEHLIIKGSADPKDHGAECPFCKGLVRRDSSVCTGCGSWKNTVGNSTGGAGLLLALAYLALVILDAWALVAAVDYYMPIFSIGRGRAGLAAVPAALHVLLVLAIGLPASWFLLRWVARKFFGHMGDAVWSRRR